MTKLYALILAAMLLGSFPGVSLAQMIYTTPGLGSEQFMPHPHFDFGGRGRQPQRQYFIPSHREWRTVKVCGIFLCQFRSMLVEVR